MNRRGFFRAAAGLLGLALPFTGATCRRVIGVDYGSPSKDYTVVATVDTKTWKVVRIDSVEVGEGETLLLTGQAVPAQNGVRTVSRASR
jgi:hypothetical protein